MRMIELVREGEAPAEIAGLYRDIRHCLRTTYVPLPFRVLAAHRGVLRAVWEQLRPNVITRAFEESASDLRGALARASVGLGTRLIEPVLSSAGIDVDELDEVREQVDLFHYTDPKILLCLAAFHELTESSLLGGHRLRAGLTAPIPTEPDPSLPGLLLAPEEPGGVVGEIFHAVMMLTGLPVATVDLRALAHWPDFLQVAWDELAPVLQHRGLSTAMQELHQQSSNLVQLFPHVIDLGSGLLGDTPNAAASLARVVTAVGDPSFRLAIFVSALKVALDGPQEALDTPYGLEWNESPIDELEMT